MPYLRPFLAMPVVISLVFFTVPPALAGHLPVGILTLAIHAHLDDAAAFPGLSVFEGERLSTEVEGRLGIRAGHSVLTLGGRTQVELVSLGSGLHVDVGGGSVHFFSVENELIELHAEEAIVWPASPQTAQGSITILGPKVLQITAERGNLNFRYHEEFQTLPEGQTYRVYLDSPTGTGEVSVAAANKAAMSGKVTYFIVGVGVAGSAAWGIHDALRSSNPPISPVKP
jgi:hypothetical protein